MSASHRGVAVFAGHMIDGSGRSVARFPSQKEGPVRERLAETLAEWGIGPGDLAICGGARGGDILFAELCLERGVEVHMLLPLPEDEFRRASVRGGGEDWDARFTALLSRCEIAYQRDRLGPPDPGEDVFERNNDWILDVAMAEADGEDLFVLLVWDEVPQGDGPGGTAHFAERAREVAKHVVVVNPTRV